MNSILNNQRWNQLKYQPSFKEFAASMTPEKAKNQIEMMLQNGQITPQQLNDAKQIVNSILSK